MAELCPFSHQENTIIRPKMFIPFYFFFLVIPKNLKYIKLILLRLVFGQIAVDVVHIRFRRRGQVLVAVAAGQGHRKHGGGHKVILSHGHQRGGGTEIHAPQATSQVVGAAQGGEQKTSEQEQREPDSILKREKDSLLNLSIKPKKYISLRWV